MSSSHGVVSFTLLAKPLPEAVTAFLQRNVGVIKKLLRDASQSQFQSQTSTTFDVDAEETEERENATQEYRDELTHTASVSADRFWPELEKLFDAAGPEWAGAEKGLGLVGRVCAFGPNGVGPNLLFGSGAEGVSCVSILLNLLFHFPVSPLIISSARGWRLIFYLICVLIG